MEFTYNPSYVALSIGVAILGSFTGLVMTSGIRQGDISAVKLRMVLGALGVGGGIWSMHFIAMLAVMLPVELSYNPVPTVISALIAISFTGIAFWIVGANRYGRATLPVSALFLGLGIGGMHYLGMYGIQGNCTIEYSLVGVLVSVVIAIQASGVALWFAFRKRAVIDTLLGSVALGLAIALMHYSAMESTRFLPANTAGALPEMLISEDYLALTIAITMYFVCGICLMVFSILTYRGGRSHQQSS
jgi:NO-binding membrane sensor protein with MHYT domain